jgi:hypothetical protein
VGLDFAREYNISSAEDARERRLKIADVYCDRRSGHCFYGMCGLELLGRIGVVRLAFRNLLRWVFLVFWELSDRFVNAKSLVGVCREERLIVSQGMRLELFLNLRRNEDVLAEDLLVRIE